jgi:hypothetical protein
MIPIVDKFITLLSQYGEIAMVVVGDLLGRDSGLGGHGFATANFVAVPVLIEQCRPVEKNCGR